MAIAPPFLDPIAQAHPELKVIEPIRAGGQKSVWRATYRGLPFALKVLVSTDEAAERAKREISIMHECQSPRIVRFGPLELQELKIGEQKYLYYLEEYIDGSPLDSVEKPFTLTLCKTLGLQICEAIVCLWERRIVHRDIKPGNIMLREDRQNFVLLDVGLALDLDASSLTQSGNVVGTPRYWSPDQLRLVHSRRDLDFRSDLHALGVVLYECLTGVHPLWNDRNPQMNILANILHLRPLPPSDFRPDTPIELEEIILRLLEKEPNMRYARISHLATDLEGINLP